MKTTFILSFLIISICTAHAAVYNILDFGADSSGKNLTTSHIQATIDHCFNNGGGVVYVPPGKYLTGTINLRSNVEFRFESGAMLVATTDLTQYQIHNEHPAGVFYTEDAENVSITGTGKIFGQGMEFMYRDSAKVIEGDVLNYVRQKKGLRKVESGLGDGPVHPGDRFHQMIVFSTCKNVRLTDFECIDAPYWTFLIVHCDRVTVSKLSINNNLLIPNSDGLDINSSSNVNVSDCIFTCGDDAIVLSGYAHHFGDPGYKDILAPSKNINISNCILQSRSSGIRIGGWDQNHMSNYNFDNITIFDSNCGINITVRDSGSAQNINFNNIRIETRLHTGDWWGNGEPIKISAMRGAPGDHVGIIKNIKFTNVSCIGENSIILYASGDSKLENITFSNFDFTLRESPLEKLTGGNFDLRPTTVKDKEFFSSDIPVVYIENAENVSFFQGTVNWQGNMQPYHKHAIEAVKVKGLNTTGVLSQPSPANKHLPAIKLTRSTKAN